MDDWVGTFGYWQLSNRADPRGLALYLRHYSSERNAYKPNRKQFVAPGECIVLLTQQADALFVWRKALYRADNQEGIECSVFRNEGAYLASDLIKAAIPFAIDKWGIQRLFTYVNIDKIKPKAQPGNCFRHAGFKPCGYSKSGLLLLERRQVV